jgi:hypothetical protein
LLPWTDDGIVGLVRSFARLLLLILAHGLLPLAVVRADPAAVPGLVAWYRTDKLPVGLRDGDAVETWKDESGKGHDLRADKPALSAIFGANQANGLPAVRVRKGGTYSVANPFTLTDHTLFVVYQASEPDRALFRSADEFRGVVLRAKGASDRLQSVSYNSHALPPGQWTVTVLARQGDALVSFIDGVERSAGGKLADPIQVAVFFDLALTRFVRASSEGLLLAEMLFYDRYLDPAERDGITRYLADKYDTGAETGTPPPVIETAPAASLAQLSTSSKIDVNEGAVAIPWDVHDQLDPPFGHDPAAAATRLSCAWDGTRVRLYAALPLSSAVAGANVRLLFRVNGATFLRGEGRSGTFGSADKPEKGSVQAEVLATLGAGDYVEVVAIREGAPGMVTIEPALAVFIAETR